MNEDKLYKTDSNGNMREWWVEWTPEGAHRTHSGVVGGKTVTSGWKYAEGKNIGKINETSVKEQVMSEIDSQYAHQLYQGKYHLTQDEAASKGAQFFAPMLAATYGSKTFKIGEHIFSQPKFDGIRCVAKVDGLWSRQGKPITSCPHIEAQLAPLFHENPDIILDGELYNHTLKSDFEKITSLVKKQKPTDEQKAECAGVVEYHVYDVFIAGKQFSARYDYLVTQIKGSYPSVKVSRTDEIHTQEEADELYANYLEDGYEGQMLRSDDIYHEGKRPKALLKRKTMEDAEFIIEDIVEGVGNWAGAAKSVTIRLPNGETQSAGMRGTFEHNQRILKDREELIGTLATVASQGETGYGKLRFPVVTKFWRTKERDM